MNVRTFLFFALMAASPFACGDGTPAGREATQADAHAAADAPDHPDEEARGRIEIPPTVRRNLGIEFAEVQRRRVAQTLRVPGAFEFTPRARREYRIPLPGRVELLVEPLDEVAEGDPLYRFQSPRWPELQHEIILAGQAIDAARADIRLTRARREEAERKLEALRTRLEGIARADFRDAALETDATALEASLPRLDAEIARAETRLANARSTHEHAIHRAGIAAGVPEEQIEAEVTADGATGPGPLADDWVTVRAAAHGVVESLATTDGAFVETPGLVLTVVQPDRLRFRAHGLQADLAQVRAARTARIVPPRSRGIAVDAEIPATLRIGVEAHPTARTVTLWGLPDATAPWARAGVSAFLELEVASSDGPALAIPASAVVQDGLDRIFFRRSPADPAVALRVVADLGVSDGRWVVLHSGVGPGDEVVVEGAYELMLASQRAGGAAQGGHVHPDGTVHEEHH